MDMKKLVAGVLACCIVGGVMPSVAGVANNAVIITANAEEGTYEQLTYRKYDDHIEISNCDREATEVVIPAEIEGLPVTGIEHQVFAYHENLKSVEILASITSIQNWEFSYCKNLTSIKIPDSVTSIGSIAFGYCSALTSIRIPDSVTIIGKEAFTYCKSLTSIEIPNSVTSIVDGTFSGCEGLTSIEIPASVTSIGNSAFSKCTGLTSVNVSENNKNFSSADGILFNKDKTELIQYPAGKDETEYVIPANVTSIGDGAFSGCAGLTSIKITDGVTSIGNSAFSKCTGLTSIEIPASVTSIGSSAFSGCAGLTSIEITDGVTSIGERAFGECTSLTSITIPVSVTSIEDYAFFGCTGLTSVTILNPECEIDDYSGTTINETATIYGYDNSTAQVYAEEWNRKFESLGKAPETTTTLPVDITTGMTTTGMVTTGMTTTGMVTTGMATTGMTTTGMATTGMATTGKTTSAKTTTTTTTTTTVSGNSKNIGDANCDGKVNVADATAIVQHIGNQDEYGLSAQGLENADTDGDNQVTGMDAIIIQRVVAGEISLSQLPYTK